MKKQTPKFFWNGFKHRFQSCSVSQILHKAADECGGMSVLITNTSSTYNTISIKVILQYVKIQECHLYTCQLSRRSVEFVTQGCFYWATPTWPNRVESYLLLKMTNTNHFAAPTPFHYLCICEVPFCSCHFSLFPSKSSHRLIFFLHQNGFSEPVKIGLNSILHELRPS